MLFSAQARNLLCMQMHIQMYNFHTLLGMITFIVIAYQLLTACKAIYGTWQQGNVFKAPTHRELVLENIGICSLFFFSSVFS